MNTVTTTAGPVTGRRDGGVHAFLGIPYAAPPVGDLRFRRAEPVRPWSDPLDAAAFGPTAPQNPSGLTSAFGLSADGWSEDCLSVNVWTSDPAPGAGRPVMVWIHGGGFTIGSAAIPFFDGASFARHGVVFVSLQYRLGVLGFLGLSSLGDERFAEANGTLGLTDQVVALRWVQENVAAFGGDPTNVTVFGESAGGQSICGLLAMPSATGLFHRAINQSGPADHYRDAAASAAFATTVLDALGLEPPDLSALATMPIDRILAAQQACGEVIVETAGVNYHPTIDGDVLPAHPLAALRRGSAADVALMIGTTTDEWTLAGFSDPRGPVTDLATAVERAREAFGDRAEDVVDAYRARRPEATPADIACAIGTDQYCRIPCIDVAEAQVAGGGRAHMFEFAWPSTAFGGMLKATHGIEVPFVFDNLHQPVVAMLTGDDPPQSVADEAHRAWIAFATDGDPGWPAYDAERRATKVFNLESEIVDDLRGEERRLWAGRAAG